MPSSLRGNALDRTLSSRWWRFTTRRRLCPLPDMYGKNLTFKTGGVDGCDCEETLKLIAEGKLDTEPLITHTYLLSQIDEAYELFENKRDGVIKVAVECERIIE